MINTNDPLPAIEIAGEGWVSWQPRLYFQRIDDYYGDKEDVWKRMTLAHLVAVLHALTKEQRLAVLASRVFDLDDWPDLPDDPDDETEPIL